MILFILSSIQLDRLKKQLFLIILLETKLFAR